MARKRIIKKVIRRKDGIKQRYNTVPVSLQKQIFKDQLSEASKKLKSKGSVKLPEIGTLRIKIKKATRARKGINPFTKEPTMFKAKPRRKVVKFKASKELEKLVA